MDRTLGSNRGLIVIDLQAGFVSERTANAAEGISELLAGEVFDPVVFTRFRNPENSPHRTILGWDKMSTPAEYELWDGVRDRAEDVFDKPSYTAVTPEFRERIRREGAQTVFLAGMDTDCCVLKTAVDLFEEGVRPVVLADYCGSGGGEVSHSAGITALRRLVGRHNVLEGFRGVAALREFLEARYFGQGAGE